MNIKLINPICPYCDQVSQLTNGKEVYPHIASLQKKNIYICRKCDAYVGCHPDSTKPLGRLANVELRSWKMKTHATFDPIWRNNKDISRSGLYKWLAGELNISGSECHIGMFDIEMCKQTIDKCNKHPKFSP